MKIEFERTPMCRFYIAGLACLLCMALVPPNVHAQVPTEATVRIYLMTMGPGDHLYTRGGHAALTVSKTWPDGRETDKVYNYGDTDWQNPDLVMEFFKGELVFFLGTTGDVRQTVGLYGLKQNRTVYHQLLNLSDSQARSVAAQLEEESKPENREYLYHHLERICTTRVLDLLDRVVGGEVKRQLGSQPNPETIRDLQHWAFSGYHLEAFAADLFLGRLHDRPIDKYYASFQPRLLREYIQTVTIPNPVASGSETAFLAGPPEVLRKRYGPDAIVEEASTTSTVSWIALAILILLGSVAMIFLPKRVRLAGIWLAIWSLPFSLIGVSISLLMILSAVPEFMFNELLLVYPPSDLLLLWLSVRFLRGRGRAGSIMQTYVYVRLGVIILMLLARCFGLAYQEPMILAVPGIACITLLTVIVRRLAGENSDGRIQGSRLEAADRR